MHKALSKALFLKRLGLFSKRKGLRVGGGAFTVPVYQCTSVPVNQCTSVPVYQCTSLPVYQCTSVPVYCTSVSLGQVTSVPVYKCSVLVNTCTLVHLYTGTLVYQYTGTLYLYTTSVPRGGYKGGILSQQHPLALPRGCFSTPRGLERKNHMGTNSGKSLISDNLQHHFHFILLE